MLEEDKVALPLKDVLRASHEGLVFHQYFHVSFSVQKTAIDSLPFLIVLTCSRPCSLREFELLLN